MTEYGLRDVVKWIANQQSGAARSAANGFIDLKSDFWIGMLKSAALLFVEIDHNLTEAEMRALIPDGACEHLYFNDCPAGCHNKKGNQHDVNRTSK